MGATLCFFWDHCKFQPFYNLCHQKIIVLYSAAPLTTISQIHENHERTISLRFLVTILTVLRFLDLKFPYTVQCLHYKRVSQQFFWGEGVKSISRDDCEQQGGKKRLLSQLRPRIRPHATQSRHDKILCKDFANGKICQSPVCVIGSTEKIACKICIS